MENKNPAVKIKKVKQAVWECVLRSELKTPEYNPRKISTASADRLKRQIKEDGLIDTIVVNKRTMNVVGGNQRTAQLDHLYKYVPGESDYQVNVQMIDVDELTEIKINTRLNNPDAMGEFDSEKLFDIVNEFEINPLTDFNMDRMTFDFMANEYGIDNSFNEVEKNIKQVRNTTLTKDDNKEKSMQKMKKTALQKKQEENKSGDSEYIEHDDYIVTIVFNSNQEKHAFMKKIGRAKTEKFMKVAILRDVIRPEYL